MAAKRFLVHGQVQGVGFRWFVGRHAERLNLRGFARNVHDGSVEVVAAGSEAALAQLGQVLAKGPATARGRVEYELEYGTDALEMHRDAVSGRDRVLIVDDVLATGGTAQAAAKLVRNHGAQVVGFTFLIELDFLKGRERLKNERIEALLHYA